VEQQHIQLQSEQEELQELEVDQYHLEVKEVVDQVQYFQQLQVQVVEEVEFLQDLEIQVIQEDQVEVEQMVQVQVEQEIVLQ
jgi:hypothetical protein